MNRSFTLIELLIVVAIIGILAAIAVPNFLNAQIRAKIAKVEGDLKSIEDAFMMYRLDYGAWPPHLGSCSHQHRPLTTPIPYLSTSVYDPFQKKGTTMTWHWFCGQYHAEPHNEEKVRLRNAAPVYWDTHKNASFFTKSVGPDMDSQTIAQGLEYFAPYDASNGLVSLGTLYRPFAGEGYRNGYPYTSSQYPGLTDASFGCNGCDN